MKRAFKYRLLPTEEQATYIKKTIGCARVVYNALLTDYKEQFDRYNLNNKQGDKPKIKLVTSVKENFDFLDEVDSLALMNGRKNLETAFKNFFNSRKGKRKGKKTCFPKLHKKSKCKWAYTTNNQGGNIRVDGDYICIPKIKWVKFVKHRELEGEIRSITVSQERNGDFYISILCAQEDKILQKQYSDSLRVVGLDMSYSDFVVDSESTKDDTKPKYVRQYRVNEKKRSRLNRSVSRKRIGSNNRNKARIILANLDRHISNCRKDFCHKMSKHYASNFDVVVLEDINMQDQARLKMKGRGKSVNDLGFGMFKEFLKYKCNDYHTELVFADKWFPSSKTCNHCGFIKKDLTLNDREWICPDCGTVINRDYNAACNLRDYYFKDKIGQELPESTLVGDRASTPEEIHLQVRSLNQEAVKPSV